MYQEKRTGKIYEARIGSRVQVKRGKACMTSGGLRAGDIMVTSKGRYVSKAKSEWGKKHGKKQLADAGFGMFTKGAPGVVKTSGMIKKSTRKR